jgi:hypothetical protein
MTLVQLTGAQGYISKSAAPAAVSLWADADFDFKLSTSPASHPRTGKRSDFSVPGKLSVSISAKNVMKSAAMMGGQITDAATTGGAQVMHAGLTAPGADTENITDMTETHAGGGTGTASRIRFIARGNTITTGGVAIIVGTNGADQAIVERVVLAAAILGGTCGTSSGLFKTVLNVALLGTIGTGTVEVASIVGDATYSVGTPEIYNLEFGGVDAVSGNYVKVFANNCFITGSGVSGGDAGHIFEDAITFQMQDIDADLTISDLTTG